MNDELNNDEFDEATVTMVLDDGTELECSVIAIFPVDDKDYIALLPNRIIDGFEEGEVLLYRYEELEEDEIDLTPIDNDDEYEAVADAFEELLDEEEFNALSKDEDFNELGVSFDFEDYD